MPAPAVYIETTIVSYLTAWPSRDVVRLAHEALTREWWSTAAARFELFTSELVIQEASSGDSAAAAERLKALAGLPKLTIDEAVIDLAEILATTLALPKRARADAVHVALAAVHGMSYLLTWNCRHMANATFADKIEKACESHGCLSPRICTPEQLMESP
jgi:predicted nucleic acid-binding protein